MPVVPCCGHVERLSPWMAGASLARGRRGLLHSGEPVAVARAPAAWVRRATTRRRLSARRAIRVNASVLVLAGVGRNAARAPIGPSATVARRRAAPAVRPPVVQRSAPARAFRTVARLRARVVRSVREAWRATAVTPVAAVARRAAAGPSQVVGPPSAEAPAPGALSRAAARSVAEGANKVRAVRLAPEELGRSRAPALRRTTGIRASGAADAFSETPPAPVSELPSARAVGSALPVPDGGWFPDAGSGSQDAASPLPIRCSRGSDCTPGNVCCGFARGSFCVTSNTCTQLGGTPI
jgi:hypothetical protein